MSHQMKLIAFHHFVAEAFLNNSFPLKPEGGKISRAILKKGREAILSDDYLWMDMGIHGLGKITPDQLQHTNKDAYEHAWSNFWGGVLRVLIQHRVV